MNKNLITICTLLLLAMLVLGYLLYHYSILDFIDTSAIGDAITALGWIGIPAFMLFGMLFSSIGLPRQAVAFIGGYVFGTLLGVTLATMASVLGAMLTFYTARWLARPFVLRKYPHMIARIDHFTSKQLFLKILLIRFLPFGTNLATNLAAGAAATPAPSFALASFLGYIPQMTIFALSGHGIRVQSDTQVMVAIGLFLVSLAIAAYLYRQHRNQLVIGRSSD